MFKYLAVSGATALLCFDAAAARPIEGMPEHLVYMDALIASEPPAQQQLYAKQRLWTAGDTLKVCFFGGDPVARALIASVAAEWQAHANLKFDFGAPGSWRDCQGAGAGFSQIRIGFSERGFWSAVGRDSINRLNQYQPSMNLEGFDQQYSAFQGTSQGQAYTIANVAGLADVRDRGTILHEFGHAIGLLHEHQNPALGCRAEIKWTGPGNAYDYYWTNYRWSRLKVDRNIGPIAEADPDYVPGAADRESIMIYAQPVEILIRGADSVCFVEENNTPSAKDKALVKSLYRFDAAPSSDLAFTAEVVPGGIVAPPPSGPAATADHLRRVRVDLQSDDGSVRREARRQLALEIRNSSSPMLLTDLLADAANGSYREQLGVLVAIQKADPDANLSSADKSVVATSLTRIEQNKDPLLTGYSNQVRDALAVPR